MGACTRGPALPLSPGTRRWGAVSSPWHPCSVALLLPSIRGAEPRRELAKPRGRASPEAGVSGCPRLCRAVPHSWILGGVHATRAMHGLRKLLGTAAAHHAMPCNPLGRTGHCLPCHAVPCNPPGHTALVPAPSQRCWGGFSPSGVISARPDALQSLQVCPCPRSRYSLPAPAEAPALQSPSSHPARHGGTAIPINPAARRCLCRGPAPVNPGCGDFAALSPGREARWKGLTSGPLPKDSGCLSPATCRLEHGRCGVQGELGGKLHPNIPRGGGRMGFAPSHPHPAPVQPRLPTPALFPPYNKMMG